MAFTARLTSIYELNEATVFGTNGRTLTYLPISMRITGADRHHANRQILSANLSAVSIALAPFGVSAPGAIIMLITDQPVDLRLGVDSAPIISAVRQMVLGAQISNIYVTVGSNNTRFLLEMAGGSNVTIVGSVPFP